MSKIKYWLAGLLGVAVIGGGYYNVQSISRHLTGTATALTDVATSTLTAAQICDSSFLSVAPVSTTPTLTLPSTTTLFANCIGIVGQYVDVNYRALTTSTILVAGVGGTLVNSSANTVAANKGAVLRFIHNTNDLSGTYLVYIVNLLN